MRLPVYMMMIWSIVEFRVVCGMKCVIIIFVPPSSGSPYVYGTDISTRPDTPFVLLSFERPHLRDRMDFFQNMQKFHALLGFRLLSTAWGTRLVIFSTVPVTDATSIHHSLDAITSIIANILLQKAVSTTPNHNYSALIMSKPSRLITK